MKVNIFFDVQNKLAPLNGYLNINLAQRGTYDISTLVCDAEANEIILNNVIQTCPYPKVQEVLAHWVKKLRLGGQIIISGLDAYSITREHFNGMIGVADFNRLMYGYNNSSILCCEDVVDLLESFGLAITAKTIDGVTYIVKGERYE